METAAERFTRDIDSQEVDRKNRGWDQQHVNRRARRYVDVATGQNPEGDGPYPVE